MESLKLSTDRDGIPDDECAVKVEYNDSASCGRPGVSITDASADTLWLNWAEWDATVAAVSEVRRIQREIEVGKP